MRYLMEAICVGLYLAGGVVDLLRALPAAASPFQVQAQAASQVVIARQGNFLTVRVHNAPWREVVQEVVRHTGIRMTVAGTFAGTLSAAFEALPLEEGLRRLFGTANMAFLYGRRTAGDPASTTVVQVWLFPQEGGAAGGASGRSRETAVPAAPQTMAKTQEADEADGASPLTTLQRAAQRGETERLREALMAPDQALQMIAFALWAVRDLPEAVGAVVDATQSEQPDTRMQALQLLAQSDQVDERTVFSALEEALSDAVLPVKSAAVQALAERGGGEALRLLREAVHDPDPAVRILVIESVTREELTLPLLREAMGDEDATVRAFAAFKLEQIVRERR